MSALTRQLKSGVRGTPVVFGLLAVLLGGILGWISANGTSPLFIAVGLIGAIVLVLTVSSPEFGLLVLVFITYTRFSDVAVHLHNAPSIAKSFVALLFIAILIRWAVFDQRPQGWQRAFYFILAYGLVGFASLLYAANTARTEAAIGDFIKDAVIAIAVTILLSRGAVLRHVTWTLIGVSIFLGSISVYQVLTGSYFNNFLGFAQVKYLQLVGETSGYRITGPVGDPNYFAQVMVALVPFGLERLLHEKKLGLRLLAGLSMLLAIMTVIFTYSRGGFVALAVTLVAALFIFRFQMRFLPILLLLIVALALVVPPEYTERIFTLQELFSTQGTLRTEDMALRGRASETLSAFLMIRDYPVLGVGWNNFPTYYQQYSQQVGLAPSAEDREPHNLYLEVATETGILGLTAFLAMLWGAFRGMATGLKKLQKGGADQYAGLVSAVMLSLIGYLTAAIFIHGAYPRYFYLLIGIAFSIPNLVRKEINGNGHSYYLGRRNGFKYPNHNITERSRLGSDSHQA